MLNLRKLAKEREEACQDKVDLFDFYNKNWDKLIAEIENLRDVDDIDRVDLREVCDECDARIPDKAGGSLANKHHAESCSLYDHTEE